MIELLSQLKDPLVAIIGFLIIAVASEKIAKAFQLIHLPLVTGLIFTGILAGPYLIGLITESSKASLTIIKNIALPYIAFSAGAELYLHELRSKIDTIKKITLIQSISGFILGTVVIYFIADYLPFADGLNTPSRLAISILLSVLFLTPSPAALIAVISELKAKGPFTQTILGVVLAKDFIVVVLFAIVISVAKPLLAGESFAMMAFVFLVLQIILSLGIALLMGKFLHLILIFGRIKWLKTTLILLLGLSNYYLAHYGRDFSHTWFGHEMYFEPLLICLIASFYVANYTAYRAEFLSLLQDISIYVYVCFFTLTGATMNLGSFSSFVAVVIGLFLLRFVIIGSGSLLASAIAKEPAHYFKISWMPYIAQAGVALGLVTVVANEFPGWGTEFSTICIAVIILNEIVGPPLIARAITSAGENRTRGASSYDGIRDAVIFGFESQSLALARQLKENGWEVKIATKLSKGSIDEPEDIKIVYDVNGFTKEEFQAMQADKSEAIVTMLSDEENLKICETAYLNFGTRDMIVRLNHRQNYENFLSMGAKIVDPSTAIVSLLDHFVRSPQATSLLLGMEKGQDTRDVEITNSDVFGLPLRDLRLPSDVIILSIMRGGQTIISHGYTRLRAKDIVTLVGSIPSLDEVQLKFER